MLPALIGTDKQVNWAWVVRHDISDRFPVWAGRISGDDITMRNGLNTFIRVLLDTQIDANFWLNVRWILPIATPDNEQIARWILEAKNGAQQRFIETALPEERTGATH